MRSVIVLLVLLAAVPAPGYIQPRPSVSDFLQIRVFWECYYRDEAGHVFGFSQRAVRNSLGYDSEDSFVEGVVREMSRDLRLLNIRVRNETSSNFKDCLKVYTSILCPRFFGVYMGLEKEEVTANCK